MVDEAPTPDDEELGAQVANDVMGWRRARRSWAYSDEAELWHSQDGVPLIPCAAWQPERDDAQAMQVLERMCALGFEWKLAGAGEGSEAEFRHADGRHAHAESGGRRHSLLLAALRAVTAGS